MKAEVVEMSSLFNTRIPVDNGKYVYLKVFEERDDAESFCATINIILDDARKEERQRIASCFRERADYQIELISVNAVHVEQAQICAEMFVHCARLLETGKEKLTERPLHGYNHGK